jgi:Fe-S oxidoreductase
MAAYRAEFLHHYYRSRRRPRAAYSMGLIHRWSRWLGPLRPLANVATGRPLFGGLARLVAGIAPQRPVPQFAPRTFRQGWRPRAGRARAGRGNAPRVVLWTDTFNNQFAPDALHAAAELLCDAGCEVVIPRHDLCCGRPYYDFGWLDEARQMLGRTLHGLRRELDAGAHLVGLEPSCLGVFRDELPALFPKDATAALLSRRTHLLGEFLDGLAGWRPPALQGRALLHSHCHTHALFDTEADARVLRRTGLDVRKAEAGCCGMAGAFGYETHKYEVSRAIFDQGLAPLLAGLPDDGLVVADGFSCRQQVAQLSGRPALTLAEVLRRGRALGDEAADQATAEPAAVSS